MHSGNRKPGSTSSKVAESSPDLRTRAGLLGVGGSGGRSSRRCIGRLAPRACPYAEGTPREMPSANGCVHMGNSADAQTLVPGGEVAGRRQKRAPAVSAITGWLPSIGSSDVRNPRRTHKYDNPSNDRRHPHDDQDFSDDERHSERDNHDVVKHRHPSSQAESGNHADTESRQQTPRQLQHRTDENLRPRR